MIRRSVVLTSLLVGVCAASSTSAASSLDEGLVGYWPFTEGQGEQSADKGPYRAHAVLNRVGWATGEFGTAVSIGKLNSNLVIPNIAALDGSTDPLVLGQWNTEKSHDGLIDELRLYKRALTPAEVALLAERTGRDSGEIKVVPPVQPRTLVSFETRCATLTLNEAGWVTSLLQKATSKEGHARELLAAETPMVTVVVEGNRNVECRKMSVDNGILTATFPRLDGHARLRCESKGDYLKFTALEVTVPRVTSFVFFQCAPGVNRYRGGFAGLVSDDDSGIALRALDLQVNCSTAMSASTSADLGLTGYGAGLAAGPRSELRPMLKAMAKQEDVPRSPHGGPWAAESPMARLSYLFVQDAFTDTASWIDLARRGGFGILHFREPWFRTFGDYRPNPKNFPGGMEEMVAAADRLHAAGLKLGLHTLSGCIRTESPYITPVPSQELISLATYTIAKDFGKADDTLYVNEPPVDQHSTVFTYHGATNVFRIGTELVQYTAISRQPPYCFGKCTRGAFGTQAQDHPAGVKAEFLKQVYLAFYPVPGSGLMDKLSGDIARAYNTCKADFLYFDGAEGMGVGYPDNCMRWTTFRKFNRDCLNEASNWGHHNWWFHSRTGAWDSAHCAWKPFQDQHVRSAGLARMNDLLEPQMGWWSLNGPGPRHRRQYLDETEYWMAKNMALDASMSLGGLRVGGAPANARAMDMLTVIGWYEQHRLANYFDQATIDRVREPGRDFRLRLSDGGAWQFTPVEYLPHKAVVSGTEPAQWTVDNRCGQQPFRVRIEVLQSPLPPDPAAPRPIIDFSDTSLIASRNCAANVTQEILTETADVKGGPRNLRIRAVNRNDFSVGVWTSLGTSYEFPYRDIGVCSGVGLWVKGDGSGAVLNVQFRTDRMFGAAISEHYVDLDFTGWRYCELLFRERDSDRAFGLKWPYVRGAGYELCHRDLQTARVSEINLLLNRIPAKGQVDVTVGPIVGMTAVDTTLRDVALTVNGRPLRVPVAISSGDLLELDEDGAGVHYDQRGALRSRFQPECPEGIPVLNAGINHLAFGCVSPGAAPGRAVVSAVALGEPFGTRAADVDWSKLRYEYDMPRVITRFDGRDNCWTSVLRDEGGASPGDQATLEFDIAVEEIGANKVQPTLVVNGRELSVPAVMASGQVLRCRDERSWTLVEKGQPLLQGEFAEPLPALTKGVNRLQLRCDELGAADCRISVRCVKVYGRWMRPE